MTTSCLAPDSHTAESIEKWLISEWKELLKTEDISTESDFFDLGADSLTVIRLLSRIEKMFSKNILDVDTLFVQSKLSQTAKVIYTSIQPRK